MRFVFSLLLLIAISFSSCRESCTCSRTKGCTIMTATNYSTGNVDERKVYCSENYNDDPVLYDSTQVFYFRNYGQNRNIQRTDSVYLREEVYDLRSKELSRYENVGFTCTCAK